MSLFAVCRGVWPVGLLLASLLVAAPAAAESPDTAAAETLHEDYPRAALPDALSNDKLCLVEARGEEATVLICMATDCPISTEFMPTIIEIAEAYRDRGVAFIGIDPNGGDTLEKMAAYAREIALPFPMLKDAGGKISRRLLFSVTPEARVFDASGKQVYSGRIDDRYRRGGASDPNVAKDLENALDQVLAGEPVSASRTKAIGCPIQIAVPQAAN